MRFLHSPQEFSVSDFYHHYKNALPKIVIVTQGYFGEIGIETYDRDQVLRIHTHSVQKRVVADVIKKSSSNLEGKQLSIPVEFPTKFYVINKHGQRSKKDEFLSEILQKHGKSLPITVEFSDRDDHKLLIGSELRSTSYFQQLSLVDTYEDVYLLGNPISEGKLYSKVLSVPLYLQEMRLSIVTGIEGCPPNVWQIYIDGMTASVDNQVKFDTTSGNKNIAVLRKSSGTNYALTSPCEYYNMDELSASAMDNQSEGNTQPNYQNPIYEPVGMGALDTSVRHENVPPNVQSRVEVLPPLKDGRYVSTGATIPPKRPPPVMPKTKPSKSNVPADQGLKQNKINTTDDTRPLPQMPQYPKDNSSETEEAVPSVKRLKAMIEQTNADKQIAMQKRNEVPNLVTTTRPRIISSGDDDYGLKFEPVPEELNLKDFYERFNSALPKVVMVTQGYYGEIGLETYDKDQVIRIHTYSQQKRVVCEVLEGDESYSGLKGKYLTIPTSYPVKFNVIKHGTFSKSKSKDLSLTEIIDTYELPVRIQFSKADDGAVIAVDSREISTKSFSRLEVKEVYEEVYLLGNPIAFGKLYSNIMSIPVYLPDIKLSVVKGVKGESMESWDTYFAGMNRSVQKLQFDRTSGNKNIAIYSASRFDTGETDQYTYQYPTQYYNPGALQSPNVEQQNPRASGLYEDLLVTPQRYAVCLYEPVSFKKRLSESFTEKSYQPPVPLRPSPLNEDTQTVALPVPRKEAKHPSDKPYTVSKEQKKLQASGDRSTTENIHMPMPPVIDRSNKPIFSTKSMNLKEFEFECSREQLSVKEFYKLYKNDLPKLTMITQGYCGNISLETYARGETLRIHKCLTQKRVIAEVVGLPPEGGFMGHKYSLPLDIECKFRVVKGSGKDLSLQEIVKKQLPVEVKFSKSDKKRTLMIGSDQRNTSYFPHLNILDVYDDLYLLGNTLSDGCLYGKIVSVPAYLPDLKLCIITGTKGKSNDEWKSYLSEMQNSVEQKVDFGSCSGNKDIAIYDSDDVKIDSEFSFVSPNIYTNLEELLQGNIERHSMEQISSNVYEEIPADKIKDKALLNRPASVITKPMQSSRPPRTPEKDTTFPRSKPSVPLPPPPISGKKPVPLPSLSDSSKPPVPLPISTRRQSQQFNVKKYTINDISSFLRQLKLDKYIKRFSDGRIDGVILAELDIECLEQDFKLKRHQAIKLLNFAENGHIPSMERSVKALSLILAGSDERIDVRSLTVPDICDSLQVLNLGRHIGLFEKELIDGSILVKLSESDLKNLGLSKFEAVKLLTFATKGHIPK